jgi:hypothetical protein
MANPAAQMLKKISKLVFVSLGISQRHFEQFPATLASTFYQNLYCFCSFARFKIQLKIKTCV